MFRSLHFAYFIFEGISKGAIYLLFLYYNIFSNKFDYIELISIFSIEILYTIITPSYYAEGFFTLKWKNKKYRLYKNSIVRSFVYFSVFTIISLILWHYTKIYSISLPELILLNFVVFGNVLNRIVVIFLQSINKHKDSLFFKTLTPFFSAVFIYCLNLYFKNLVFSYLLGKFLAHVLSYLYYKISIHQIVNNLDRDDIGVLNKHESDSFNFLSLMIGLMGWVSGVGYFKIVGLLTNQSNVVFNIATAINYIAFLQFSVSGTNQLYFSKLNSDILLLGRSILIKHLYDLLKFLLVFVFLFLTILVFKNWLIFIKFNFVQSYFLALVIFTFNIFSYTINPFYYICNKLMSLLIIQIISFILFCLIFMLFYIMGYRLNFELLYLLMFGILNLPQFVLGYIYFDKFLITNKS